MSPPSERVFVLELDHVFLSVLGRGPSTDTELADI